MSTSTTLLINWHWARAVLNTNLPDSRIGRTLIWQRRLLMKAFCRFRGATALRFLLMLLLLTTALPSLHAQGSGEFDDYKVRIDAFWLYAYPGGSITDATTGDIIDLQKDFGFGP